MKNVLGIILLMVSMSSYADLNSASVSNVGWDKLTESQQAEILKNIATVAATNVEPVVSDPKKLDEYVVLGQHIGQAFSGAAKEVGVAANEFIQTPIGTLTIVLIVWHFIGSAALHLFGAIILILFSAYFLRWHKKSLQSVDISYDPNLTDIFGRSRQINASYKGITDDFKWLYWWSWVIILVVFFIMLVSA